jgi:hypothetical protein
MEDRESIIIKLVPSGGNEGEGWQRMAMRCGRVGVTKWTKFLRRSIDVLGFADDIEASRTRLGEDTTLSNRGPGRGCAASERSQYCFTR